MDISSGSETTTDGSFELLQMTFSVVVNYTNTSTMKTEDHHSIKCTTHWTAGGTRAGPRDATRSALFKNHIMRSIKKYYAKLQCGRTSLLTGRGCRLVTRQKKQLATSRSTETGTNQEALTPSPGRCLGEEEEH
jgi:hypothetical protein